MWKEEETIVPELNTLSEAYTYMFTHLLTKGVDAEEATERAAKFARTHAELIGIPTKQEPPVKGLDAFIQGVEKFVVVVQKYPAIIDIGKPILLTLLSAFTGAAAGAAVVNHEEEEKSNEPSIKFDEID